MTRDEVVEELAAKLYMAILKSQPYVGVYGGAPELVNGRWEGLDGVGLDGAFNMFTLAQEVYSEALLVLDTIAGRNNDPST